MKKGFTLIELLSIMAILAIILLIAIPKITYLINISRNKIYQDNEEMIINATRNYLLTNKNIFPKNIGDTVEITLEELITNEYINDIYDNKGKCNGYILITNIGDEYSYNPQLKCGNSNIINNNNEDGLVAHFKLNANDYNFTPNKFSTVIHGAIAASNRFNKKNSAMLFNGSSDYIDLSDSSLLKLNLGGTISAWIYMNSWGGTSWSNTIVGKGYSSWAAHHYILFKYSGTNQFILSVSNGTNYLNGSGPRTENLNLFTWYNIVATWDSSKKCIYVDGNKHSCVDSNIMPINSNAPVSIGKTGTSTYYFDGIIDDLKIYNRALNESEILYNYNLDLLRSL